MDNTRNQYQSDVDTKSKHFDPPQNRYNRDTNRKEFSSSNENDRNSRNYTLKNNTPDNSYAYYNVHNQKNGSNVNSEQQNQSTSNAPWVWKKGDMCFAKYWEDNMVSLYLKKNMNIKFIFILLYFSITMQR